MSNINVLICAPLPPPKGGIATWVTELLEANSAHNSDTVINIYNTANTREAGEYSHLRKFKDGIKLLSKQIVTFKNELKMRQYDVVHLASAGGFGHVRDLIFASIAKLHGSKVVVQLHYGVNDKEYRWAPLAKFFLALLQKLTNRVLTFDPKYADRNNSVSLSFNGIGDKTHSQRTEKTKSIVFVGWMVEQKGIFELVNAWNQVVDKNGWQLVLIGPAQQKEQQWLNNHIDQENSAYLGELERGDVLDIVSKSRVFALPSHTEGFPFSVLEAMQSECALVVSNVGGMEQLFTSKNSPGWLIDAGDAEKLESVLKEIVSSDLVTHVKARNAKKIFKSYFTSTVMFNDLMSSWKAVL